MPIITKPSPVITIEAVRRNPWNAVWGSLPDETSGVLLELAYFAAGYCSISDAKVAAIQNIASFGGWLPAQQDFADAERRSLHADRRIDEIRKLYRKLFGRSIAG